MKTSLQLVGAIHEDPSKYLREPSLELMEAFLNGYFTRYCESDSPIPNHDYISYLNIPLVDFSEWIAAKYNFGHSRSAFAILSLLYAPGKAFEKFFSEIDEFCRDKALKTIPQVTTKLCLTEEAIDRAADVQRLKAEGAMIFGWASIDLLRSYLEGDSHAIVEIYGAVSIFPDLDKFEKWINKIYKTKSSLQWEKLLLFLCNGDQTKAYFKFFSLLDNFMSQKRTKKA